MRQSEDFDYLVEKRPTAFVLLALIAKRAKRTLSHPDPNLEMGDALIGDYESYGVTERQYRTDKQYLEMYKFATFKTTNKGTVARIVKTTIFDINPELSTDETTGQRQASDRQATTNKNDKNEKNDKKTQEALQKIEETLKDKYELVNGVPSVLKGGYWTTIENPVAFAGSLSTVQISSKVNPITIDPLFQKYKLVYRGTEDSDVRMKMSLEPILFRRYPQDKYTEAWKEAEQILRGI